MRSDRNCAQRRTCQPVRPLINLANSMRRRIRIRSAPIPRSGFGAAARGEGLLHLPRVCRLSVRRSVGGLKLSGCLHIQPFHRRFVLGRDDAIILDSYDLGRARASSNFDQRHLFNLGYVYDLPFFKNPGLTNKILGGWQWSGITTIQSGTPFSVANGVTGDNAGVANGVSSGSSQSYPDLVGDPRSGMTNFPLRRLRTSTLQPVGICGSARSDVRQHAAELPDQSATGQTSIWRSSSTLPSRKAWPSSFAPKLSTSSTTSNTRGWAGTADRRPRTAPSAMRTAL